MEQIKTINSQKVIFLKIISLKFFLRIKFFETFLVAWELSKKGYLNRKRSYQIKQQLRCIYYSIFYFKFSSSWITFLTSQDFKVVFQNRPRLYNKAFLPYVSNKWNKQQKVKVIKDTYQFIEKNESLNLNFLTNSNGLQIASFCCSNNFEVLVNLGYEDRFRKEGELVLSLNCNQLGGKIFAAAISFEEIKNDYWICRIGCVQGYKENTQDAVKMVQKMMYGMRPSALLVFIIQELCQNLNVNSIYGISDKCQVYRKKHGIHISCFHRISFDYDQFWKEIGGVKIDKQWFKLPEKNICKEFVNIQSHKRAMYRNRYQMLDLLSEQILNKF
jgi:uncharacterized protein